MQTLTRTRFTPELENRAKNLFAEGMTPVVVAQNIGVSVSTLKRHGLVAVKKRVAQDSETGESFNQLTSRYKKELLNKASWHERKAKSFRKLVEDLEQKTKEVADQN